MRQIDIFFMKAYASYCNDKVKYEELESLSSPEGVGVVLELKDEKLNISSEIRVDSMKISLEDSTFAKLDELIGEENYQIF